MGWPRAIMEHTRKYETVEVGDIVRMNGDTGAFGTCIVVSVTDTTVVMNRPHAAIKGDGYTIDWERIEYPAEGFTKRFEVFVTGPSNRKDNRNYGNS